MNSPKDIIHEFSEHLFWDVDKEALAKSESKVPFIIQRVLTHGVMSDWKKIKQFYGLEKIEEVSLKIKNMDNVTLAFLCAIFNRNKEDFYCYTHRQSHPHFWDY